MRFFLLLLTTLLSPSLSHAQDVGHPVALSDRVSAGDKYMGIRLLNTLILRGPAELAELSDLAWDEDEEILYGVTDRGLLLHLQPIMEQSRLTGMKLLRHFRLRDKKGKKLRNSAADSEGLALEKSTNGIKGDSTLAISFERYNRVDLYSPEGQHRRGVKLPLSLRDPRFYLNSNKGLEALARHPDFGYMTGPEKSKRGGSIPIFSQFGQSWNYQPLEPYGALVALEALDDGRLLLLERSFNSVFEPVVISLSSARPATNNTGSTLQTKLLARFDSTQGWQTQNIEGLTRYRGNRFFMVSDNGGAGYLQTQLLYFEVL